MSLPCLTGLITWSTTRTTGSPPRHGFPLWDDEGHLGDDFDYLHDKLGLDRELYEDLDAWNQAFARGTATEQHGAQGRELWERLASQLPSGVLLRPWAS